jgi:hypothetical protein
LKRKQRPWQFTIDQHRRGGTAGDVHHVTLEDEIVSLRDRLDAPHREKAANCEQAERQAVK